MLRHDVVADGVRLRGRLRSRRPRLGIDGDGEDRQFQRHEVVEPRALAVAGPSEEDDAGGRPSPAAPACGSGSIVSRVAMRPRAGCARRGARRAAWPAGPKRGRDRRTASTGTGGASPLSGSRVRAFAHEHHDFGCREDSAACMCPVYCRRGAIVTSCRPGLPCAVRGLLYPGRRCNRGRPAEEDLERLGVHAARVGDVDDRLFVVACFFDDRLRRRVGVGRDDRGGGDFARRQVWCVIASKSTARRCGRAGRARTAASHSGLSGYPTPSIVMRLCSWRARRHVVRAARLRAGDGGLAQDVLGGA